MKLLGVCYWLPIEKNGYSVFDCMLELAAFLQVVLEDLRNTANEWFALDAPTGMSKHHEKKSRSSLTKIVCVHAFLERLECMNLLNEEVSPTAFGFSIQYLRRFSFFLI